MKELDISYWEDGEGAIKLESKMITTLKYKSIHEEVENLRFQPQEKQELARILHELIFCLERLEERVKDLSVRHSNYVISKASDSSKTK